MYDEFRNNGVAGEIVTQSAISDKSKAVAALLCFFLGMIGIHRFYLGRVGTGAAMLIFGCFGIATSGLLIGIPVCIVVGLIDVIDFFRILCNGLTDNLGRKLK